MSAPRVLIATAVAAERDAVAAVLAGRPSFEVRAVGVGPAAAAAGTAFALAEAERSDLGAYALVVSAGIGGGFPGLAPVGSLVVAERIVAADLGAETPEGFASVAELGFGAVEHLPPAALVRGLPGAVRGAVLTVSTVTGSARRAAELRERCPGAVAEAMEGFGVAEAAARWGVPVLELRGISNAVGPRDRGAWRIGEALAALGQGCGALPAAVDAWLTGAVPGGERDGESDGESDEKERLR
ncbi:futalosine hydrolase [Streptomyces polyrhachis]|uniref:Futalosine hydrolase n=1 Tax=Streptomyces polyrhachis TaxID=1282885 RepID=A0ABW2GGH9_9ACTN